ncbi:hypothetical protein L1987_30846 [Smallanthus sonchifolius]|uniref:Uncharacterized protein n=1 Tax=Smallanthus sonchifolius TaxID=185202 RepID=A0ACB9I5D5_9ASTR|nr:hypothetical protein L1987_30846 [Smallanthus sonchifolius]
MASSIAVSVPLKLRTDDKHTDGNELREGSGSSGIQLHFPNNNKLLKRGNNRFTHFISLPLALHPSLVDKLINFQNSILGRNDATGLGIDASIFTKPQTLHLTVLMLRLRDERLDAAVRIFQEIEAEVMDALGGQPVSIKLKGLASFSGSFDKVDVLYAPVEVVGGNGRLLRACEIITDAFTQRGLAEDNPEYALKFHVTVMNSNYRKRPYGTPQSTLDARRIVDNYGSEAWGECAIPEIHLSKRNVFDENGYFKCCASIPLNPRNMQMD